VWIVFLVLVSGMAEPEPETEPEIEPKREPEAEPEPEPEAEPEPEPEPEPETEPETEPKPEPETKPEPERDPEPEPEREPEPEPEREPEPEPAINNTPRCSNCTRDLPLSSDICSKFVTVSAKKQQVVTVSDALRTVFEPWLKLENVKLLLSHQSLRSRKAAEHTGFTLVNN